MVIGITSQAQAGIHLEPYLGYEISSTFTYKADSTLEYESNSIELGGRVGYELLGLSFGLDYNFTPTSFDIDRTKPSKASGNVDYKKNNLGAFLGFELPMVRIWGSYYFSSNINYDKDRDTVSGGDVTGDELSGSGYGIGAGFTGLPFISINLEYRNSTYNEYFDKSANSTTKTKDTTSGEPKVSSILLSISAPFHL